MFRRFLSTLPSSKYLEIKLSPEHTSRFHYRWLRDNCPSTKQASSGQRLADIPSEQQAIPLSHHIDASHATIKWQDGHESKFCMNWLRDNAYDKPTRDAITRAQHAKLWSRATFEKTGLPSVEFCSLIESEDTLWTFMDHLARDGICVVNGVPRAVGQVGQVAQRVSYLQETLYGRTWHVKVVPQPHNAAYSPVPLPNHMDLCYYESPPGLQMLHFIATECRGGANSFVDMFNVVERLKQSDYKAFESLQRIKFSFHFKDNDNWMYHRRPLINVDQESGVTVSVFWSPPWQAPLHVAFEDVEEAYRAYGVLSNIVNQEDLTHTIRFNAGQLVAFNNRRIAHARLPFIASDGLRHAEGTYVLLDEFNSKYRTLQRRRQAKKDAGHGLGASSPMLMPRTGNYSFK